MPVKMFKCLICGEQVTKRSSVSLKKYEIGDGRACRTHEEVIQAIEQFQKQLQDDKETAKAEWLVHRISLVAMVKVMHTIQEMPLSLIYWQLSSKVSSALLDEVKAEVECSGAKLSSEKITDSLMMYGVLHKGSKS